MSEIPQIPAPGRRKQPWGRRLAGRSRENVFPGGGLQCGAGERSADPGGLGTGSAGGGERVGGQRCGGALVIVENGMKGEKASD